MLRAVLRDEMISWHKKKQDEANTQPLSNTLPPDMTRCLLFSMDIFGVVLKKSRLKWYRSPQFTLNVNN